MLIDLYQVCSYFPIDHYSFYVWVFYIWLYCWFQVTAGNAENVKDDLNGLDKAVSVVLGQRTIERNQLLVSNAKSKISKQRDDKGDKGTKPEGLVRLFDLLLQVYYSHSFFFSVYNL